jgi:hypothetical protein
MRTKRKRKIESELDKPMWAVVSSDHVKATDLTYDQAAEIVGRTTGIDSGICIVTNDVAARLKESKKNGN